MPINALSTGASSLAVLAGVLWLVLVALVGCESTDPHARVPGLGMAVALIIVPLSILLVFVSMIG